MASNERVYQMRFGRVWPLLVNKVCRKGGSEADVLAVTSWLTGYTADDIARLAEGDASYRDFFEGAPAMNPKRDRVTGVVCGVRVEEVEEPLMREIRRLDKLVDELARGRALEKVLRS
jgi:hypothetical protein